MQQVPPHSPFGDLPQSPAPTYPPLSSPDFLLSPRSPPATPKSFATSWITGPRSSKTSSKSSSALFFGGHTLPVVEEQQGGQLRRQLKSRHVGMISIGGVIGTGLFLGSAQALQRGGPAGLLLGYTFVGTIAGSVMLSLGEMIAALPLAGGHITLAQRFVGPAMSFTLGWTYWYNWMIALPAELNAAAVLMGYWNRSISPAVFVTVCFVPVIAINVLGTRVYGETEFWFSSIKVITILGLILLGIIIDAGGGPNGEVIGVRNWSNPSPFVQYLNIEGATGRFLGFWSVAVQAVFSYSGTEIVAMAAGEAKNPRVSLPRAIKTVYARILLFYVIGTFIIGLLVSSSDRRLARDDGTALSSPFVIAIQDAGIKALPSIINGAILTSAWSAASSNLVHTSSRTLYGLASNGHAPKIFTRVNGYGLPWVAVSAGIAFGFTSYMSASTAGAATVFRWLVAMTSCCVLLTYSGISFTYIRFYRGTLEQGIDRSMFPYKAPLQPYLAVYSLFACILLVFTQGWRVFMVGHWNLPDFLTTYIPLMLFPLVFCGASCWKGWRLIPLIETDFFSGSRDIDEEPDPPARGISEKLMRVIV